MNTKRKKGPKKEKIVIIVIVNQVKTAICPVLRTGPTKISLAEVRLMAEEWQLDFNTERPHKSLGYFSPLKYAEQYYQSRAKKLKVYPQMANGNPLKIEKCRRGYKIFEKQKNSN